MRPSAFDNIPSYYEFVPANIDDEAFGFQIGHEMLKDSAATVLRSPRNLSDEIIAEAFVAAQTTWWLQSIDLNIPALQTLVRNQVIEAFSRITSLASLRYLKLTIECLEDDMKMDRTPKEQTRTRSLNKAGQLLELISMEALQLLDKLKRN